MDKSTEQLFEAPAPELLKKLEYFLKKETVMESDKSGKMMGV